MSQENVEVVRRGYKAFDRQQFDLELAVETWDPEGELIPAMAGAVEGKVYRGIEGLRSYYEELFESFSQVRLDDREFTALDDRVLVLYRLRVRGHDSGVAIDQPGGALYTLRGGKIVHARSYLSRAEALEAAGLLE
jgi:ketosteroid isomerase-like protein